VVGTGFLLQNNYIYELNNRAGCNGDRLVNWDPYGFNGKEKDDKEGIFALLET